MPRLHAFELEDQPWFPAPIRDLSTDYLHFMQNASALHRAMLPFLEQALQRGRTEGNEIPPPDPARSTRG